MSAIEDPYCPACGAEVQIGQVLSGSGDEPLVEGATGKICDDVGDRCVIVEQSQIRVYVHPGSGSGSDSDSGGEQ